MKSDLLPTGQIVNTHGLRGHVKVMPWADDPADLLDFDRFFLDGREYAVQSSSLQKSMVLLKLEGVDSIEDASRLRGKELCISRDDVELEDGVTAPAAVRRVGPSTVELSIHEGRNRQVRRMCEAVGHPVTRLVRTAVGPVRLGDLRPGGFRHLSNAEIAALFKAAGD